MAMSKRTCSIEGCERTSKTRGYCSPHYRRWLSTQGDNCSIEGCERKVLARGWCSPHWQRWSRHGDPEGGRSTPYSDFEEAFAARTELQGDCLTWIGSTDGNGYGVIGAGGNRRPAHRYAWERVNGSIPDGMLIDHRYHCPPRCVTVSHLRLATHAENIRNRAGAEVRNASGVRNVTQRESGKYVVQIQKDYKPYYLGSYLTLDEAATAAREGRRRLFGDFAGKG